MKVYWFNIGRTACFVAGLVILADDNLAHEVIAALVGAVVIRALVAAQR